MKKRNSTIDLMKLLFSIMVILLHVSLNFEDFTLFRRGLLAVDFFFIVSGYLFYNTVNKTSDEDVFKTNVKIIWKKYKKFFPYILIGFIGSLVYRIIIDKIKIHTILNSIFSLSLLQMAGFPMSKINNVTWYLSVMLLVMFIIYPIIKKNKEKFFNYLCPLIIIIGAGVFNKNFGNFSTHLLYKHFMYNGFLRGLIEINIGLFLAYLASYIKNIKITKIFRAFLGILEILGYSFIILMMNSKNTKMDLFIMLVLAISIFISFNKLGFIHKVLDKIKIDKVSNLSLGLYCLHIPVIQWMSLLNNKMALNVNLLAFLIVIITIIIAIIAEIIINKIKFNWKKLIIKD